MALTSDASAGLRCILRADNLSFDEPKSKPSGERMRAPTLAQIRGAVKRSELALGGDVSYSLNYSVSDETKVCKEKFSQGTAVAKSDSFAAFQKCFLLSEAKQTRAAAKVRVANESDLQQFEPEVGAADRKALAKNHTFAVLTSGNSKEGSRIVTTLIAAHYERGAIVVDGIWSRTAIVVN